MYMIGLTLVSALLIGGILSFKPFAYTSTLGSLLRGDKSRMCLQSTLRESDKTKQVLNVSQVPILMVCDNYNK